MTIIESEELQDEPMTAELAEPSVSKVRTAGEASSAWEESSNEEDS